MRLLVRVLAFAAAAVLSARLADLSTLPPTGASLVAPLPGVVLLWLASASRRSVVWDLVALVAVLVPTLVWFGESVGEALFGVLLLLIQTGLAVVLLRLGRRDLWGAGGQRAMSRLSDFAWFLLAVALGTLVSTVLDQSGLGADQVGSVPALVTGWVRDFSWATALGALGLLVGPAVTGTAPRGLTRVLSYPGRRHQVVESVVIYVVTVLLYLAIFAQDRPLPITYVLTLATVWAALRLTPVVATGHALASGIAACTLTAVGHGIFAGLGPHLTIALPQAFLAALAMTAVALSLTTSERELAARRAAASEHAAAERATMLTAVMESMAEGIVVVRADGSVVVRNPASRRLLGLEGQTLRGRVQDAARYGLVDADGVPLPDELMPTALHFAGQEVQGKEYFLRSPDHPEGRVIEVSVTRLPDPDGQQDQAIVNLRDVTKDRQDRDNLASFAGVVAHDLNNPLAIVTGWSESLAEAFHEGAVDPEDGTPMVGRIQGAATHMRQFIDDLLSFTIARDHPLRITDTDLSAIAEGIASMRREGDTRPRIEVQPGLHVRADTAMVRQLLDNLIGNAAKYVGPGVRPRIQVLGQADGDRWIRVVVRDNGIGVPPEQRERIFENFQRAHTGEYAGTGIGLAICRRVVERHGGWIRVEDNPDGPGSQFAFTLPALP